MMRIIMDGGVQCKKYHGSWFVFESNRSKNVNVHSSLFLYRAVLAALCPLEPASYAVEENNQPFAP